MAKPDPSAKTPRFIVLASIGVVLAALYFAQEVLIPLALAVLLSFLLAPLVSRLEKLRLPRSAAVVVTVLISFSLLFGIGYVVYNQLGELTRDVPRYKNIVREKINRVRGPLAWVHSAGAEVNQVLSPASEPAKTSDNPQPASERPAEPESTSSDPFGLVKSVGSFVLGPIGTAFIVTVFAIFMLQQREDLRDRVIRLVGRNRLTLTTKALDDAADRVSRYLLMQSIVNGSVGLTILIVLFTIGKVNGTPFPAVALWALLAALLRFIPYVGIWVAAVTPIVLSLGVYDQARVALEVLFAYGTVEVLAANFLEPTLYGSSTGIATLAVLVAAAFWTWLWGPVGLLLSTPLTVCLVVMGKYVPQLEFLSILLAEEPALSPPDRIYQRLLAMDYEEAADLVTEYAAKMPLEELYETVLVQALAMAEQDLLQGALDAQRHTQIQNGVRDLVDELGDRAKAAAVKADAQAAVEQARGEEAVARAPAVVQIVGSPRVGLPRGCSVNVVCLPANGASDEIAATMLGQLLEQRGYCVIIASVNQLASEMVETVRNSKADVVCVSALPPSAITHARYLCKRLHGTLPETEMVVGLWATERDLSRARERISVVRSVRIAGTFSEAMDQILQLAQPRIMMANGAPELPASQVHAPGATAPV
jgi:predicted PurR-regulated permease PerM/methylmalonyl-CoA mutase cobalamin-binding subunit